MKPTQIKTLFALAALLSSGAAAWAQSPSNGVPGPGAYASFSQFIADRNIFDPSRQPHISYGSSVRRTRPASAGLPSIELVGTMIYEKGPFAFFNANDADDRKALSVGGEIAGYRVASIAADSVQLETADKKESHTMKVGEGFQQENGKWVFATVGELPRVIGAASVSQGRRRSTRYRSSELSSPSEPAAPPASANEQNAALKRLMQLREKENQ